MRQDQSMRLEVKERPDVGVYVKDLLTHVVHNADEMDKIMTLGNKNSEWLPAVIFCIGISFFFMCQRIFCPFFLIKIFNSYIFYRWHHPRPCQVGIMCYENGHMYGQLL